MGPVPEQRTRRESAGTVSNSEYHPFAAARLHAADSAIVTSESGNVKHYFSFQTVRGSGGFPQIRGAAFPPFGPPAGKPETGADTSASAPVFPGLRQS